MSKGNTFESELLDHVLNNANIALIGDATGLRGSSAAGSLYLSLHTADPAEGGDQTTSEISYTGYARVALARDGTQWGVASGVASLSANKDFGEMTAGAGGTVTHFALGTASAGAGKVLYKGAVSPNIAVVNGVIPRLKATTTTISED